MSKPKALKEVTEESKPTEAPKPSKAAEAPPGKDTDIIPPSKSQQAFLGPLLTKYNEKINALAGLHLGGILASWGVYLVHDGLLFLFHRLLALSC